MPVDVVTGASGVVGAAGGGGFVWWLINKLDRERNARLEAMEKAIKALETKVGSGLVSKEMCTLNMESSGKDVTSLKCLMEKVQQANRDEHKVLVSVLKELRGYQVEMNKAVTDLAVKLAGNGNGK